MSLIKKFLVVIIYLLLLFFLTGCDNLSASLLQPTEKPQITLTPSLSAIIGHVDTTAGGNRKPLPDTVVRLAKVYWNKDKTDGAYILEGGSSPSAITKSDGSFTFINIQPGDYVIVVGDVIGYHVIISDDKGKAKIFSATLGNIVDIGQLTVDLPAPQ